MADSIRQVQQGRSVNAWVLPTEFNWPIFVTALLLMAAPLASLVWRTHVRQNLPVQQAES
jgi:hypothetical protein